MTSSVALRSAAKNSGVAAEFNDLRQRRERLARETEINLYRIAQEALNNIRKHAGVSEVRLYMSMTPSDVLLVIKDEGHGFVVGEGLAIPSIGIQSMRDRAKAEGGTIDWSSEIGKGTEILIRIPY